MAGELSFLEVDGVELANAARTFAYLARGLQPWYEISTPLPCAALTAELPAPVSAPWLDGAPWYTSAAPHSADFLGLLVFDLQVGVKAARSVQQRLGGRLGSAIGTEIAAGAAMQVQGCLVARSAAGLAYGRQWLETRLAADPCNPCALSQVRYRAFCPPAGMPPSLGEYLLYDVGLTGDGIVPGDGDPRGAWLQVSFTLSSQHAARFLRASTVVSAAVLAPAVNVDSDVIDFSFDPFAGSNPVLACATNQMPPGAACSGYDAVNHRYAPLTSSSFTAFYRVGVDKADVTLSCKLHTSNVANDETLDLVGRWDGPDTATSRGIAGHLRPSGGTASVLEVGELLTSGVSIAFQTSGTLAATSAPFTLAASTDYWLRLRVSGDVAIFEIYTADPYDAFGNLIGLTPLAATPWPPARVMSATGELGHGTWGVTFLTHGGTSYSAGQGGWLDDLRVHDECMAFERWLCEAPPLASSSVELAPTLPGGTVAAVVTFDASRGQIANAYVEARLGGCASPGDVFARIDVPLIVEGGVLVIDSSRGVITLTMPDGALLDATNLVALAAGRTIEWIEAPACDAPICVSAGVSAWCGTSTEATVTIERQERTR